MHFMTFECKIMKNLVEIDIFSTFLRERVSGGADEPHILRTRVVYGLTCFEINYVDINSKFMAI